MFYVTLWLVMMTGWITLLVWGMTMETRDRKRAAKARAKQLPVVKPTAEPGYVGARAAA